MPNNFWATKHFLLCIIRKLLICVLLEFSCINKLCWYRSQRWKWNKPSKCQRIFIFQTVFPFREQHSYELWQRAQQPRTMTRANIPCECVYGIRNVTLAIHCVLLFLVTVAVVYFFFIAFFPIIPWWCINIVAASHNTYGANMHVVCIAK